MRVFGDRGLVRKKDRVNFFDIRWPFVTHTEIFKGFEATFFTRPADRAGRESTTLKTHLWEKTPRKWKTLLKWQSRRKKIIRLQEINGDKKQ